MSDLRARLEKRFGEAEDDLEGYLTTVNSELAIRTEVFKARLAVAKRYWDTTIEDLQQSAATVTAEQRAQLEEKIADLRTQVNERLAELQQSGGETWSAMRDRLSEARQDLERAYNEILETIEKARG